MYFVVFEVQKSQKFSVNIYELCIIVATVWVFKHKAL